MTNFFTATVRQTTEHNNAPDAYKLKEIGASPT